MTPSQSDNSSNIVEKMGKAIAKVAITSCDYEHNSGLNNEEECAQAALLVVLEELGDVITNLKTLSTLELGVHTSDMHPDDSYYDSFDDGEYMIKLAYAKLNQLQEQAGR